MRGALCAVVFAGLAAGCAERHDVVVPPAPGCQLPPTLLQACPAPAALEEGLTYGDLMKRQRQDRENLVRCGSQMREVAAALDRCRTEVELYNARIGAQREALPPR